ncbi:MAG: helix-turn-helix domain-containing protein [Chloroflexota bacterium]
MTVISDTRPSDAPFVEGIWRSQSEYAAPFISRASSHWEMVVKKYNGETSLTLRGPETKATRADHPADAEFFGIVFKLGTFIPHLPTIHRLDRNDITLPESTSKSFWLQGASWQIPDYDNADTFVYRLIRQGLLVHDPIVEAVLQGQPQALSIRSVRRRFLQATGLTHGPIFQIARAQQAVALLAQGVSILDTVDQAGYFDQPHLTRSLKHFMGETPAQIARVNQPEQVSFLYNTVSLY